MYKKLEDITSDLNKLRSEGIQRGKSIGFTWDSLPITFKEGSTTYIGAAPHVGKTEFTFDILINLSCLHGWKHCIYTPETGTPTEIYAELISKYIGKEFIQGEYAMTEIERMKGEYFVSEHFYIIDPIDEELTIERFYALVDEIELNEGVRFNTTLIDPWNELTEDMKMEDMNREDKYLSRILGTCRKNARSTNRHNIIINHVRDQPAQKMKNGSFYYPMPSPRDMAGGQVWFRKGMLMIMLWRPPIGWENPNDGSVTEEENELVVKVAKSKPKGVSINGIFKLYYDFKMKQYYQKYDNKHIYANRESHNFRDVAKVVEHHPENVSLNHIFVDFDKPHETPF